MAHGKGQHCHGDRPFHLPIIRSDIRAETVLTCLGFSVYPWLETMAPAGMAQRRQDRYGSHRSRQAMAKRRQRELQRQVPRRVLSMRTRASARLRNHSMPTCARTRASTTARRTNSASTTNPFSRGSHAQVASGPKFPRQVKCIHVRGLSRTRRFVGAVTPAFGP